MVVKMNRIERMYSHKVAVLIRTGYTISSEHTRGCQSHEVTSVSLTKDNGKTVIKVALIDDVIDWKKTKLKLVVLRFENADKMSTLWNAKGEVIEEITFYEVDRRKKIYCDDEEEFNKILLLRKERFKNREYQWEDRGVGICNEKIKDLIWKIIRKIDGYKSVSKKKIKRIVKCKDSYVVCFEDKPTLHMPLKTYK